ncbi:hypothetical protein [Amycolatopsis sp. NPDC000740]|uniref:hypothetical protein n=1 Tax=Amycolatopsis sp. NPDC000740 TaxID=3154269 RepID=UPI00332C87BD
MISVSPQRPGFSGGLVSARPISLTASRTMLVAPPATHSRLAVSSSLRDSISCTVPGLVPRSSASRAIMSFTRDAEV